MSNETFPDGAEKSALTLEQPSLLDQIVNRQAEAAARLMPVMTIKQSIERSQSIKELKDLVLEEGLDKDYGTIPGTKKPTLLQPGAQKICAHFGYVPSYEIITCIEDWAGEKYGEPLFYYHVKCTLMKDGVPVGQAIGSCNSWEKKYRWRSAERTCPACGAASIIKGKEEYGGGFVCFQKKGGCGAKFKDGDPAIVGQQLGQVPNPDFADSINPVQKIACKRAYVSATLSATGASQYFIPDMEDQMNGEPPHEPLQQQPASAPRRKSEAAGDPPQAAPDPPALTDAVNAWKRKDQEGKAAWFSELQSDLYEATGSEDIWSGIRGKYPSKFPTIEMAVTCFKELWLSLAELKKETPA